MFAFLAGPSAWKSELNFPRKFPNWKGIIQYNICTVSVLLLSGGQGWRLHFKWKPWWNSNGKYRQIWTADQALRDTLFLLIHTAGRNSKKRLGRHHSLLQTQDSKDKQLFNYLCIRISIDRLKKALSPWQQTSHSLYHQLSVCLPAESHPRGTGRGGRGEWRGGEVSYSLLSPVFTNSISSWYNAPYSPFPPSHSAVLSFPHTTSTLLSILTSSHLSL